MKKEDRLKIISILIILVILAVIILLIYYNFPKIGPKTCDYDSDDKNYIGKSIEECSRIKFLCVQGTKPFEDECGCGCEKINASEEKNFCISESRKADVCLEIYEPVCGWFNSTINCIKYPCAQTYSNECFACINPSVEYWTDGKCPVKFQITNL